ncbi:MAG: hypothetical protein WDN30_06490 [Pararobbsia sp.]
MTLSSLLCEPFSRYAARVLHAAPALAEALPTLATRPVTRAWMETRLDALCAGAPMGAGIGMTVGARADVDADGRGPAEQGGIRPDEARLKQALRRLRAEVCLIVMERDLAGHADVAEVTAAMADLAELSIQRALDVLDAELRETFGAPLGETEGLPLSLGVVGMGKLGGPRAQCVVGHRPDLRL